MVFFQWYQFYHFIFQNGLKIDVHHTSNVKVQPILPKAIPVNFHRAIKKGTAASGHPFLIFD
jgi:hypothetical protein